VEASRASLARYVAGLEAASAHAGVRLRYRVDVAKCPEVLAGFDQVVVATGAAYRLGLGGLARALLRWGWRAGPVCAGCSRKNGCLIFFTIVPAA
jgi:hypothetical protein